MPSAQAFSPTAWERTLSQIPGGEALSVSVLDTIDSTNTEARRRIASGVQTPGLIVARAQTGGRGRMGRSFFSPPETGAYFTLYWPAGTDLSSAVTITGAAAVAVLRAIRRTSGITPEIKWVNDLYLGGRKLAGILAESVLIGEERMLVLGIGINLSTRDFPPELSGIAGSLGAPKLSAPVLIAAVVEELMPLIRNPHDRTWLEEYRRHSCVIGREISWTREGETHFGRADGIDESGALLVTDREGKHQRLFTGEISLRVTETQ